MRGYAELQLRNFSVNPMDKLNYEVDNLFFFVLLKVVSCDHEREVIAFVGWLLSKDLKLISTEGHESFEHVSEHAREFIELLDGNRDTYAINTGLDETRLLLIFRNDDGIHD